MAGLVKEIDAVSNLKPFVVILGDSSEAMEKKLQALAAEKAIKMPLSILADEAKIGPYNMPKDADIMVVLYKEKKPDSAFSLKKDEINKDNIDKIVSKAKDLAQG